MEFNLGGQRNAVEVLVGGRKVRMESWSLLCKGGRIKMCNEDKEKRMPHPSTS